MHHLLKFGATCKFFQAAPILRAFGIGDLGASRLQVELVLLARTNVLAVLLGAFFFHLHFRLAHGDRRPRPVRTGKMTVVHHLSSLTCDTSNNS
jgi:hypothetical protein